MLRPTLALVAALMLGAASPGGGQYTIDTAASSVSAKVGFLGIGSKTARFPDIDGTIRLANGRAQDVALDVTLDARALTAPDKATLERLRGEKFFWVERYPTVRFSGNALTMRNATRGSVAGQLTARGVTRPVTLDVRFSRDPNELAPGESVAITGETKIDRRDFGMTAYSLIVGRTVSIQLNARLVPR